MADKRTPTNGANDVVIDAPGLTGPSPESRPLPKKSKRKVQKLTRRLDAARAAEAKRLRQSAKAHQKVDKRERQVARAAADVAAVEGRIREVTAGPASNKPAPPISPMPPKPQRPARRTAAPAATPKPAPARKSPTPKPPTSA